MGLRIKKGDTVMMIAGDVRRGRGRTGQVLEVLPRKGMAIVEGFNVFKKHQKARSQQDPGGIVEREMPVPLSKLMLVDGQGRAARFGVGTDASGAKARVLKLKGDKKVIV